MNLKDNHINKLFKTGLENQQFEISDAYLNDLGKRLDKRKNKPFLFWFLSIFALALICTSMFYITENNSQYRLEKTSNHLSLIPNDALNENKEIIPPTNSDKQEPAKASYLNEVTIGNKSEKGMYSSNSNEAGERNRVKKDTEVYQQAISKSDKSIKQNVLIENKQIAKNRAYNLGLSVKDELKNRDKKVNNNVTVDSLELTINNDATTSEPHRDDFTTLIKSDTKIDKLENSDTTILNNGEVQVAVSTNNQKILGKEKGINLLLSLEMGGAFNRAKYLGAESDYHSNNTAEQLTLNYNFDANALIKNKFIIGTGISLNQQKYSYDFSTTNVDYDTTVNVDSSYVFEYYIYQQNVIIDSVYHYTYNTSTIIDSTINTPNYSNSTTAKYFTVPFNIGYNINYKKFMFNIILSVNYNRLYDLNGGYYSNNSFELINMGNNTKFKKSYFSYAFRANVSYNIINNFYINSSFRFSPYSTSVLNTSDLERRIQTFNIAFGLTYKL